MWLTRSSWAKLETVALRTLEHGHLASRAEKDKFQGHSFLTRQPHLNPVHSSATAVLQSDIIVAQTAIIVFYHQK